MNPSTFDLLCEASQLSFPDAEKESFMRGLESMILFAGAVREYDCVYDDKKDAEPVSIKDLREDKSAPSYLPGKLLENTDSLFDCCVIPKLMD